MIPDDWPSAAPEALGLSSPRLDDIDVALQKLIDAKVLAGAATLIARHGSIARVSFLGDDDRRAHTQHTDDTIYRIFSMTKPVTGVAMGILADRGLWHPDDPIAQHLPELSGLKVATSVERGRVLSESPEHSPTMNELMTHTAGFSYGSERNDPIDVLYRRQRLFAATSSHDFVNRLAELPLAYHPGNKWRYSVSADVQGAIVERLTGKSLAVFVREEILEPLGMLDTAFHIDSAKQHRVAALYFSGGLVRLKRLRKNPVFPEFADEPPFAIGGAGMSSTLWDYARFARMLLDRGVAPDGHRVVSEDWIATQTRNHLSEDIIAATPGSGHMRFRPGFGFGYNGVVVYDPSSAGLPAGRGSYFWDGLAGTWFWVDPEHDLMFVGMVQLASRKAPALQEMTQKLVAAAMMTKER